MVENAQLSRGDFRGGKERATAFSLRSDPLFERFASPQFSLLLLRSLAPLFHRAPRFHLASSLLEVSCSDRSLFLSGEHVTMYVEYAAIEGIRSLQSVVEEIVVIGTPTEPRNSKFNFFCCIDGGIALEIGCSSPEFI